MRPPSGRIDYYHIKQTLCIITIERFNTVLRNDIYVI